MHDDHPAAWHQPVDERIRLIRETLSSNSPLSTKLPGLKSLLDDYLAPDVDVGRQDFHRRILQVFRDSDADFTYQDLLSKYDPDEQEKVSRFVDGNDADDCCDGFEMGHSLGVREHMSKMAGALAAVDVSSRGPVRVSGLSMGSLMERDGLFYRFVQKLCGLFIGLSPEKDSVLVYKDAEFQNWGLVVEYKPTFTCIPSSVLGVQRIVKYAKDNNMGVRCAGFRHSWSPIFGRDGQILLSLLGLREASRLPNFTALPFPQSAPTELESIDIIPGAGRRKDNALVRVGAACTNERLRRWCVTNKRYTLPLNVIMVEITIGGSNAPICHGAGRRHQTLSDLVRRIEYVDCNGRLRTVDDPAHLRAASGCFGLMGVVTHVTFEMSPMTYAEMDPRKMPVARAVPPPDDMPQSSIPVPLRVELTPAERAEDIARFERQCSSDFYSEWFWFPYSDYSWVNCWSDTTDEEGVAETYPSPGAVFFQFVSQFTMNVIQNASILNDLIDASGLTTASVTLFSRAAMFAMPETPVKTLLTDALHFQRGIQNIRVLDLEVEIPLPAKKGYPTGTPDFDVARRAWWDAILACYAAGDSCPQRMPLEMRIMGSSEVVMAPQRGNALGTCSIEVLTLQAPVTAEAWLEYSQGVLDKWMAYEDSEGKKLRTRPHWAKQFVGYTVADADGSRRPWVERLKGVEYRDEIQEFKGILTEIGRGHGWKLSDLKARFSNDFLDDIFFDSVDSGHVAKGKKAAT